MPSLFRRTVLLVAALTAAASFATPALAVAHVKPPSIGKLSATAGPLKGGTTVTITGSGFSKVSKVTFGTVAGSALHVLSATKLTVRTPKRRAGTVAVTVVAKAGRSAAKKAATFAYLPVPTVISVAPKTATDIGGTKLTVTGTGFSHVLGVYLYSRPARDVRVLSTTKLTLVTPQAPYSGTAVPVVVTPGGVLKVTSSTPYITYVAPYTPLTWKDSTISPPASDPSDGNGEYVLSDVSCGAVGSCMALGGDPGSSIFDYIAILKNGVWTSSVPPAVNDIAGGFVTAFNKVVCLSATFCAAAGTYRQTSTNDDRAIVGTWNGSTWSVTTLPEGDQVGDNQDLKDLACASPTFCMAVGWTNGTNGKRPLAYKLSGTTWTQFQSEVPVAQHSPGASELDAVACPAANTCFAGGVYLDPTSHNAPMMEVGDATSFSSSRPGMPDDATVQSNAVISSMTCTSVVHCDAIGTYAGPFGDRELDVQYDGNGWFANQSRPPTEGGGSVDSDPTASDCMTAEPQCVAVGTFDGGGHGPTGMIADMSYDFESEADFPSGAPATVNNSDLDAVSCVATDCVTVGNFYDSSANISHGWIDEVLVDYSVKAAEAPRPSGSIGAYSNSVSCVTEHYCVSVGNWVNVVDTFNTDHALVEVGSA